MRLAVMVATVMFWLSVVAVVAWIAVYSWDDALVVGRLGEKGSRLGYTLLLGAVASTSGLLVAYHRLTNTYVDRDAYWTGAEAFYAAALFASLFYGLYSFLGWYFY